MGQMGYQSAQKHASGTSSQAGAHYIRSGLSLRWPLLAFPGCLPLLVVEGSLVEQVLELGDDVIAPAQP